MTTLGHTSEAFDVVDAKIYPLLSDTGSTPTYGSALDVPAINKVSIDPDILYKELVGDGGIARTFARVRKIGASVGHGVLSLDVLAAIMSGTVTDGGVDPNQTVTYASDDRQSPEFKLSFVISGADFSLGGDIHVTLFKCTASKVSFGGASEDFFQPTFDVSAIRCVSDRSMISVVFNETAAPLV